MGENKDKGKDTDSNGFLDPGSRGIHGLRRTAGEVAGIGRHRC